jgi:hypothetical protein
MPNNSKDKGRWKIDWGRQGGAIFAYVIIFFGYYGIIANLMMMDQDGEWFSFVNISNLVKMMLFWNYQFYIPCYFLPVILLFMVCFWLTYKEDIPQYGIRASLWLIPFIIFEGILFYFIMFGFSIEPFILQFGFIEGYINILILLIINLSGAFSGMMVRKSIKTKTESKIEYNRKE